MTDEHPLDPLASAEVPDADPAFVDRLEADLRIAHAGGRHRVSAGWRRVVLVAPVLMLFVAVATVALLVRDDASLELTQARNVTVVLPDGTELDDPTGLELVDGAVVRVGDGGRARIGDVELAAGSVVTVVDGDLVSLSPDQAGDSVSDLPSPSDAGRSDTDAASPRDTGAVDTPPSTVAADEGVDIAPSDRPGHEPAQPPTDPVPPHDSQPPVRGDEPDRGADQTTTVPVPTTEPPPHSEPGAAPLVHVDLRVRRVDGGVSVRWGAGGSGLAGVRVVLLRTSGSGGDIGGPDWPVGAGTVLVAETAVDALSEIVDPLPEAATVVRYRAVAVSGDDVLARSEVATVLIER
ncbi:MAG: hypothetical protein ACE5GB_01940 [Acidimicrobiales bacterium]